MSDRPVVEPLAITSLYIKATAATSPAWCGTLDTVGAVAMSAFGWQVGKTATSSPYMRGYIGATTTSSASSATSTLASATGPRLGTGSGATTASDFYRSSATINGAFPAGNWTFNFYLRTSVASTQAGRMRFRVWAAADPLGQSNDRELTSGVLTSSIVTLAATGTNYNSTYTWAAPAIQLRDEYLFIQVEWEITTAGGSNTANVICYSINSPASVITTNAVALAYNTSSALAAGEATISGTGQLILPTIDGTGDIDPAEADIAGDGTSGSDGSGDLDAGVSTLSGIASVVHSIGTGDVDAGASTLTGVGTSQSISTSATLTDGSASVSGIGVSASTGTSSLVTGTSGIAGIGYSASTSTGSLVVTSSSLAGSGTVGFVSIDANGVLNAGGSTLTGSGTVSWPVITGSGAFGANTPLPNFLLHGESFVDSAGGHTVTPGGSTISSTQKKFGANSFFIDSNDAVRLDAAADLSIGSTDNFTIDLWVYPTTTASVHPFAAWNDGAVDNLVLCIRGSGALQIFDHGGLIIIGSTPFTVNAWSHVALTRSSGSVRAYLNGVQQGSTNNSNTQTFPVSGTAPKFGNGSVGGTQQFAGYLDEIRFIKGQAVWTSNFTPPSVPYDLGSPAVVAGLGTSGSIGTGVLVAGASVVAGVATASHRGTGALIATAAGLTGAGISSSVSTGVIVGRASSLAGTAIIPSVGTGTLQVSASSLTGSARVISTGTGQLAANDSVVVGHGTAEWIATGTLVAGDAALSGIAISGATFGVGDLVAGSATLEGDGGTAPAIGVSYPRTIVITDTSTVVVIGGSSRVVEVGYTPIPSPTTPQSPRVVTTGNGGRTVVVNNGQKRKLVA